MGAAFSFGDTMKIPGPTRRSALLKGYDIRIRGIFFEVVHISSRQTVSQSEKSARDALNLALNTRRTRSVVSSLTSSSDPLPLEIRRHLTNPDTGRICPVLFSEMCVANGIKEKRWQHLNGGMKVMALISTLKGILSGSRGREPRPVVIGKSVIRPGV